MDRRQLGNSDLNVSNNQIGIIGAGLIGGSLVKSFSNEFSVLVFEPSQPVRELASGLLPNASLVDSILDLKGCSVIFVAVPPRATAEVVLETLTLCPDSVVTDCAGVKGAVCDAIPLELQARFVPGHPMAGREVNGVEASLAGLFNGAAWLLTPTECTSAEAVDQVTRLLTTLNVRITTLPPVEHDRRVGLVSHLPHVIAKSLARISKGEETLSVSAGSWADMTRVATSDPRLWSDISELNRAQISRWLDRLIADLQGINASLKEDNQTAIDAFFQTPHRKDTDD